MTVAQRSQMTFQIVIYIYSRAIYLSYAVHALFRGIENTIKKRSFEILTPTSNFVSPVPWITFSLLLLDNPQLKSNVDKMVAKQFRGRSSQYGRVAIVLKDHDPFYLHSCLSCDYRALLPYFVCYPSANIEQWRKSTIGTLALQETRKSIDFENIVATSRRMCQISVCKKLS